MKPRDSFERASSVYREWGGVRMLDALRRRIDLWRRDRTPQEITILVIDDRLDRLARPLIHAGYRVWLLRSQTSEEESCDGLRCVSSLQEIGDTRFDLMIGDWSGVSSFDDVMQQWESLREFLRPAGLLLSVVLSFPRFQIRLRQHAWRLSGMENILPISSKFLKCIERCGIKRPSAAFHVTDAALFHLANMLSRWWSSRRLIECAPCDPSKPYVIHLIPTLGSGGAERLVYELVLRLPQCGFQAKAVPMIAGGELEQLFFERGLPLTVVERRHSWGVGTIIDLVRLFRFERPDIIHTHLFGADAWGRLAAFLARVPIIVTTEHNVNPDHSRIKRFINRIFARFTDRFIAVSEAAKRILIKQDGLRAERIVTVVNGIDTARVIPRPARPFHDRPRLVAIGRFYPQKDHATLFKALVQVRGPWILRLVGTGPLEGALRTLAEELHIASRIEWLGYRDDVPALLSESDVFCFPSQWEGLGLVALEAAAAGVPVIASDLEPLREVLREDEMTYVPAGDVEAWTSAIESVLHHPDTAIDRAIRAAPRIMSNVSIDRMVERYAELYRELRKNSGKKRV